ncbi:MerR family transcriptional regulator [Jiulongibacter sp. NS-SX5]|uniref:MerR family transcriptional regulator n=1 Tax=Jiulongibacter sp. NS-SX5 TaxID=3463854 RepID=UPI00405924BB
MRRYSISEIEKLTGLNPHSLRVWERRYQFGIPARSESNIRYYTDDQLVLFINTAFLLNNGMRISAVAKLGQDEMADKVLELTSLQEQPFQELIRLLASATLTLDEEKINAILDKEMKASGFEATFLFLIYPFLEYLGMLWTAGRSLPAQEHFVSHLIAQRLNAELQEMPQGEKDPIIFALLDEEEHEIGLLLSCYLAKLRNFKCVYLSRKVPVENLKTVVEISGAKRLMTMFIIEPPEETVNNIKEFVKETGTEIWYSGKKIDALNKYSTYLPTPSDFISRIS